MTRKTVVQARLPSTLVERLDKLTKTGYYSDRTEAIADAIRHLLDSYAGTDEIARVVRLHELGKLPRRTGVRGVHLADEDVRKAFIKVYGTDDVDEVMGVIRVRRH